MTCEQFEKVVTGLDQTTGREAVRQARVDGIADHSTLTTLHALLSSLPEGAMTTPKATA